MSIPWTSQPRAEKYPTTSEPIRPDEPVTRSFIFAKRMKGAREFGELRLSPDRGAGEDVAALVDEGPVGGDVDVGRMLPVGVVDEEEAAGFQFGECGLGADGTVPAIDDDKVEAGIGEAEDGGGIGRQRVVLIRVSLGLGVVERDEPEIDVLESGCGDFLLNLGEPGGIALDADEVGEATGEPEGAAAAAPLEPSHLGSEVLIEPGNGVGR